ncbi:hypothetical protein NLI96_g3101 [Meripilus lineatus]|uniref:Replication factor C subunit 1 n=1 Tax=Meripilus lineatus TaxID=2056292 RepID=A0AAD5V7E2_9APHY|nr:hypothetical protein NLI96_g3101 [Physisporinus lineatus]
MSSTKKPIKSTQGRDIRGFFGGSGSRPPVAGTPKSQPTPNGPRKSRPVIISDDEDDDQDDEDYEEEKPSPPKPKSTPKATPKASSSSTPKVKPAPKEKSKPEPKATPDTSKPKAEQKPKVKTDVKVDAKAKTTGKRKLEESNEEKDEAPPAKKPNWAAMKAAKLAGPSAPGSKSVPNAAAPDCLSGLSFVFTGELSSFSRDEAIDLTKRFGGRVVMQPSSKTSYVILGEGAGPSKLAAIKKNKLKTLDEDGFLNLIATRIPVVRDEKLRKKAEKEAAAIKEAAKEMERREKKEMKEAGTSISPSTQLWTTRYAPKTLKEICGNKGQIEKLQLWLHDWSSSLKCGFKKPGKNGMNCSRAVLITGPPGIGKTTSAHLCAKLEGFTPIELNASDARSKKLVENSTNISNTSLDGWMAGSGTTNVAGVAITDKSVLIMDEVDGMSAGDRGGVGALCQLIRKTKIPIICIANDRGAQKLKPLLHAAFNLPFKRPEATAIRSRLLTIAFKEKMKVPPNVLDQLVASSQSDIRQVLNMLSTWRLSSDAMDYDQAKDLAKMNEKYTIMTPFDITYKMLGPYMFSATSRETLGDKMELYFQDHSFVPLFIQENYLKTQPAKLKNETGPELAMKQLQLMDKAASSISDGDLVDALIHGPDQHWSLMPLHAVCSTVRPASFLYGSGGGYGGSNPMSFPVWLGNNSKQNKLNRRLMDMQARMRLKVSGDKVELRQGYIPALFPHIVKPLMDEGSSAVEGVIDRMDDYFLSREDWDAIVELGLDQYNEAIIGKKITAVTKTALTRKYNAREHPVAFHKAQDVGKAARKIAAAGPAPDLEEAYEVDDDDDTPEDAKDVDEDDDDISHDSLIKAPGKGKGKAPAKAKGTAASTNKAKPKPRAKKS